jgi:WbqC-like protein
MILTAHQPVYLPWLGLFHKIALAEKFCIFDIVQYQKKDFNNRNKIKTHVGPIWLSVPVESKDHFETKICDIRIVHDGWNKKHAKSIRLNYAKTPFFKEYIDALEDHLLGRKYEFLTDLNTGLLILFLDQLHLKIPILKASDFDFRGHKSDLVLDMCLKLKATTYIFGEQGKDYADGRSFLNNGIDVRFQDYVHPQYRQLFGKFEPYMSVIDLLFNEGPNSRSIIMQGNLESAREMTDGGTDLASGAEERI